MDTRTARARLIDQLRAWAEAHQERLVARGIRITYTVGEPHRNPQSAWLDFETDTRMARVVVWTSGLAETEVFDITLTENDPLVFVGSNELNSDTDLVACLDDVERTLV